MVYIIDARNNVGHPTQKHDMIRRLIKKQRAKIVRRLGKNVIVVQLLDKVFDSSKTIECEFRIGIDPGYTHIGFAIFKITGFKITKLLSGEVETRTSEVTKLLEQRKMYRNKRRYNRRQNVLRKSDSVKFRKPVWKNRKKHSFQPTHRHLISTHINLLNKLFKLIPSNQSKIHMEYNKFDSQKILNPKIHSFYYQRGSTYGFQNTADYVRNRDNYVCQLCKKKVGKLPNEVHHIVWRSRGGSNSPDNLLLLCNPCHKKIHKGKTKCPKVGKHKTLRASGVLNSCMKYMFSMFESTPDIYIQDTFGYITKVARRQFNIEKTHANDAHVIAFSDSLSFQDISEYSYTDVSTTVNFKQYRRHVRNHVQRHEDRKYYTPGYKKCLAWNRRKRETQTKPSLVDVRKYLREQDMYVDLVPKPGKAVRRKLNKDIRFRPGDIVLCDGKYSVCRGWASTQGKVILEDGSKTGYRVKQKDCVVVKHNSGMVAS